MRLLDRIRTYAWVQRHRIKRGLRPILLMPKNRRFVDNDSRGYLKKSRAESCPIALALGNDAIVGTLHWCDRDVHGTNCTNDVPEYVAREISRYDNALRGAFPYETST